MSKERTNDADAILDIRYALKVLEDQHIRKNQHRLGALGSQDLEIVKTCLGLALDKMRLSAKPRRVRKNSQK